MSTFIYTAKTEKGETKAGTKETANEYELAENLRQEGLFLVSVEKAGAGRKTWRINAGVFLSGLRRVSLVEKMLFTRHLAVMIEAGLSLNRALAVLARQSKNPKFRKIIEQIEKTVREGQLFSQALAGHPQAFNQLYVNMVKAGETGGNLEEVLRFLAGQMDKDHQLISRVRGAMMYPAVIIAATVGIGILMLVMVVPKLNETFMELKMNLPLTTRIIVGLSVFLRNNLIFGLSGLAVIIVLLKMSLKTKLSQKFFHKLFLLLPPFGGITQKVNSARLARTLSSLINSGVNIVQALQVAAGTLGNIYFRESLLNSAQEIQKGKTLSRALEEYEMLYPPMVIQMVQVGEETGSLTEILKTLADFYEEEVSNLTKGLSSIIEPVLMIFIGAAVGFFAISMVQPMYSMMSGL